MQEAQNDNATNSEALDRHIEVEKPEGLDEESASWGDYPLDDLLIRHESRTIFDVIRRIEKSNYIMDPDFQRDFVWTEEKQSKLIESVMMRIPLPVFYLAENDKGCMVVVDGLQRLTTFWRFMKNELPLKLPERTEINGQRFMDLSFKYQNRIEDCNLIFYLIDSKVPERARLDIFERVNSGVPLTRQQMRNCLYMGDATRFLKDESRTDIFAKATGKSLNHKTMRDREFVNRFCAFQLLGVDEYNGDMDDFLARILRKMNRMESVRLSELSTQFRRGLHNNFLLFNRHAFRKHEPSQYQRNVLNASLWDVMSTGLSRYEEHCIRSSEDSLRAAFYRLQEDDEFNTAITLGTNDVRQVKTRFGMFQKMLQEIIDDHSN